MIIVNRYIGVVDIATIVMNFVARVLSRSSSIIIIVMNIVATIVIITSTYMYLLLFIVITTVLSLFGCLNIMILWPMGNHLQH